MLEFVIENEERENGNAVICGVDEAGRGCLCGSVYAAAVILPPDYFHPLLNDSKKLSEKKREELYDHITKNATAWSVAYATVDEIEEINILNAAMLAMRRAVAGLDLPVDIALIDGNIARGFECKTRTVVKGDSLSASIAAASILAKVTRDDLMLKMAEEYPQYGFEIHKGYGTKAHYQALAEHGPSPVHRMTFLKKLYGTE